MKTMHMRKLRGLAVVLALFILNSAQAATSISLPDILAIELPNAGQTTIQANAEPMASLLASATAGGLQVTNDKSEAVPIFSFPLGGTLVTWTAWSGIPHASAVSATYSTYVFVFRNGQTPIGVSGDDYALAGNHGSSIARDSSGALHVAWLDDGANPDGQTRPYHIWYRRGIQDSNTGRVTWTAPVDVAGGTTSATYFSFVKIAASANAVHFCWGGNAGNTTGSPVNYRRLVHSGANWNFDPIQVVSAATGVNHDNGPCIAAYSDNEVHIVTRNLKFAHNSNVGVAGNWKVEALPSPSGMLNSKYPAVAVDSRGDVHIAYTAIFRDPNVVGSGNYNTYARIWYLHGSRPGVTTTWVESCDVNASFPEWQDPGAGQAGVTPTDVVGDWIDIACDEQDTVHVGWHGTAVSHAWGHDDAYCTRRVFANDGNALGWERPQRLHRHEDDMVNGFQYSWTPSFSLASNGICIPVIQYKALGALDPSDFSNSFQIYDDMDTICRVLQNGQFVDGGQYMPISQTAISGQKIASCWPSASRRATKDAAGHLWIDVVQGMDCSLVFNPANVGVVLNNSNNQNRTYIVYQRTDVSAAFAPLIVTPPANATVTVGQTATFTVAAAGSGPLAYQWSRNGAAIANATSPTYTTPITTANDDGSTYAVAVSNAFGAVTSATATLTLNYPPAIAAQPVDANVIVGQTATFTVAATGSGPLAYQWSRNGAAIANATSPTYTTPITTANDDGSTYAVAVSNAYGTVTSATATLTVNPILSWATPADMSYGTPLSATQLNADSHGFSGSFTYVPPAGTFLSAGQNQTLSVTFTPDNPLLAALTATTTINVTPIAPTVVWNAPAPIVYGTALSSTQLNASVTDPVSGLPVNGAISYSQPIGTVLGAGTGIVLSASFSAVDPNFISDAISASVSIDILAAQLQVLADDQSFHYGNAVPALTATFIGLQNGDTPSSIGLVPNLSTVAQSLSLVGEYDINITGAAATANYSVTYFPGKITVANALPVAGDQTVTVSENGPPTPITLAAVDADGDPLTWVIVWYPTAGTLTGTPPNLFYTPAPNDFGTHHFGFEVFDPFGSATQQPSNVADVTIVINHSAPIAAFTINPSPGAIGKPVTFDAGSINNTDGTIQSFTWNFGDGSAPLVTTSALVTHTFAKAATFTVSLTVTDTLGSTAAVSKPVTIYPASPVITWSNPASITYPTALSATQLNAKTTVAGTFVYTPAAGTVLHAGAGQVLSVTFTPDDTATFNTVTKTVLISVAKATPTITWTPQQPITWPAPIGSAQQNATTTVPGGGTFTYSIAAGTVLNPGSNAMVATLTPTNSVDYKTVTLTKTIGVNKFTPVVTWVPATPIVYPTPIGAAQLDATVADAFGGTLAGTSVYTPADGTVLKAGTQTLKVTFTPTDTVHYNTVSKSVSITVSKGTPVVTWSPPAPIAVNQALTATQLNATANVAGSFTYSPVLGSKFTKKGTYTLTAKFTPTDTSYNTATVTVQIVVQ